VRRQRRLLPLKGNLTYCGQTIEANFLRNNQLAFEQVDWLANILCSQCREIVARLFECFNFVDLSLKQTLRERRRLGATAARTSGDYVGGHVMEEKLRLAI
jgi:hypothetical protein